MELFKVSLIVTGIRKKLYLELDLIFVIVVFFFFFNTVRGSESQITYWYFFFKPEVKGFIILSGHLLTCVK